MTQTSTSSSLRRPPRPPFVFLDGTRSPTSRSWLATNPRAVLTERDGKFVELPSGRPVDPRSWLLAHTGSVLCGFLGYEFAWHLLDVRAAMPRSDTPLLWVGAFDDVEAVDDLCFDDAGVLSDIVPDATQPEYERSVGRCIERVWDGDLFEVNYTERFRARWEGTDTAFYQRFRAHSTGAYCGLLSTADFSIASVSPEAFLEVRDGRISAHPIKGTRPRSADLAEDEKLARELMHSDKDRAENVMIVDLMRNDLTRVSEPGTVQATQICGIQSFAGVHHLVSTVEGRLAEHVSPVEALLACFPAGSITGAPKLRAIEVAAGEERSPRGPYTGSMFLSHPDGWLTSNVLIRTATLVRSNTHFDVAYGAGGAVVADSIPTAEWAEANTKLIPLQRVAR